MKGNFPFGLSISLLLVFCVVITGCSSESPPDVTATPPPTHTAVKYGVGDIIATPSTSTASSLYFILKYDPVADEYTRALIEKNADGSWGYRTSNMTDKSSRAVLEKVYTVRVGHVTVSSVPILTPTIASATLQMSSGGAPSITKISPGFASKNTVVTVTITGTDFKDGATVKLVNAGSMPITATSVSVSGSSISCVLNLNGKSDGSYNLIVTNPDGQSDSRQGIFTIGEAPPVITSIYPISGEMNKMVSLAVYGDNFRNNIKVSFTKDTNELVCTNPITKEYKKISCDLDLSVKGASTGEWTVTVLNIDNQKKGTWTKKFTITNSTTGED
jgi:hypothetical protein